MINKYKFCVVQNYGDGKLTKIQYTLTTLNIRKYMQKYDGENLILLLINMLFIINIAFTVTILISHCKILDLLDIAYCFYLKTIKYSDAKSPLLL